MARLLFHKIKLLFFTFIILSLGLYPLALYLYLLVKFLNFSVWWTYLLTPIFIYLGIILLYYGEIIISGLIIRLFNIRYNEGEYDYTLKNKNAFTWILICTVYTPFRKLMEILPVGGLKNWYFKMLGMQIGENTLVGGVIKDPCMTRFGKNSTMGEYAIIYAHITDYAKGTINIKPVNIGNNCVIGAGAIIMPGVTIQDHVVVATGAVVLQDSILESNHIYAGIPAKPISKKIQKKRERK